MDNQESVPASQYYGGSEYTKVNNKDNNFMQWFLENKEGIENLKHLWRGWERNLEGQWMMPKEGISETRIMNEKGIHWATSIMENYLDRVFQTTNWNDEHMNFEMRQAYRVVFFGLMTQYKDFEISKVNTQGVGTQIISRIHAMLLASRGEGIRKFISTAQTINEQIVTNPNSGGFFGGLTSIFNRRGNQ